MMTFDHNVNNLIIMNNDFIYSCIIVLLKDIFYPFIILVIYFCIYQH